MRYDKAADGTDVPVFERDGWFSRSVFSPENEGRIASGLRRNLRVWRYLGQSTPSGWVGLKGTSRVGMQKELEAMLDIDLYTQETVMIGDKQLVAGIGRRDELINKFLTAFYDPRSMDDPLTALKTLETSVMEDLARAYGLEASTALRMAVRATPAPVSDQIKQTATLLTKTAILTTRRGSLRTLRMGSDVAVPSHRKGLRRVSKTPGVRQNLRSSQFCSYAFPMV